MTHKALIFDVDCTLAETEELHRAAFNRAFAAAGLGWSWDRELYARLLDVTGGKERIVHYAEAFRPADAARAAAMVADLHGIKTAAYGELVGGAPDAPYRHLAGKGEGVKMVSVRALDAWLAA